MTQHPDDKEPFYFAQRARFMDQLNLAAVGSAVSVSRHFIRLTLSKWHAKSIEGDATLVVSELVTNAVKMTGVLDRQPTWMELETLSLVTVRMIGLDTSVVIEVWDTSQQMPVLQKPDDDTEGGRGLLLVEETAKNWGSYRTPRGKLVWAEIPVPEAVPSVLPQRRKSARSNVRPAARADPWLLRSLLIGLQAI
ncbi:ATP-binding protein [Streptomyces antibioticus]|uniref:ATP-binding protein n=1 Tax=Streptomyces antibioticus TaxID=1890 RepID=UPI0022595436|nr:ATP-binding protein [Streptomyces antibioticus]MCX4742772.1 ATP-binding protein [Streptomyces antibioticus]